ncbi:N-6 DNA methylase (plasmid) [Termitidicoccus mucosus]
MEKEPFTDLLGTYYMDMIISKGGQQCHGEFHTPQEICRLIGRMLADGDSLPESGPVTICEPACGSGAMILALAEQYGPANIRRLRVTAIDINRMACDMCFINTTLWGIPTHVIHGNSLNLKFEASWRNIH